MQRPAGSTRFPQAALFESRSRHLHLERVIRGHDAVERLFQWLLAVATRIDVTSTGQKHAVEVLQHGEGIGGQLVDRWHQHRHTARPGDGAAVWLTAGEGVALALVAEGQHPGADRDQRRRLTHPPIFTGARPDRRIVWWFGLDTYPAARGRLHPLDQSDPRIAR